MPMKEGMRSVQLVVNQEGMEILEAIRKEQHFPSTSSTLQHIVITSDLVRDEAIKRRVLARIKSIFLFQWGGSRQ